MAIFLRKMGISMTHPSGISESDQENIRTRIADAISVQRLIFELDPQTIAMVYGPGTTRDVAAACLTDAAEELAECCFALCEASAYELAYHRSTEDQARSSHLAMAQFYLDDAVVLRLHASAESVAAFLQAFLDVPALELAAVERIGRERLNREMDVKSDFLRIGRLLKASALDDDLAGQLVAMCDARETKLVATYRNDWVHHQRWRIEGAGLSFDRRQRWVHDTTEDGGAVSSLGLNQGDASKITIDDAMHLVISTYHRLRDLIFACHGCFEAELLAQPGVSRRS
jgi:hypothetical protein